MSFCSFLGGEVFKDHFQPGIYVCAKCGHELFSSRAKYEHSSPWPAFTETIQEDSVSKRKERPGALKVSCGNSSLKFVPKGKSDKDLKET
ncbi:methionine-R-sulfoxide reductase B1 [Grus japonensis]|uniref:Methionine-R-sulfoxide reductase B1 n=1 Tax=Grus japonensis TaxID=30415 RepID=A0ABC9XFJ8_GRUJA